MVDLADLWHNSIMPARAIQISVDTDLLERIDRDPEVRKLGRSAFIRSAVELYLTAKRRRAVDDRIARAYDGKADAMLNEVLDLIEGFICGRTPLGRAQGRWRRI